MSNAEAIPALLIAIPIIAATLPLALGLVRERIGWSIAAVTLVVETVLAGWVAYAVIESGTVRHQLGGFVPPRGIELVVDLYSMLVISLIAAFSLAVLVFSRRAGPRGNAFYSAYLLLVGGLMGVALTGDLFNMFVFLEITGIATYALVASSRRADAAVASLKYLLIGTVGASLFLIGVGYLYVATGTLNMVDLSQALAGQTDVVQNAEMYEGYDDIYTYPLVLASFGFIAVGLLTKAAIYPLHTWQPDAYATAPHSVTALISALVSTVGAYALGRVMFTVYTVDFFEAVPEAALFVVLIASISILAGSVLAVIQRDVKRMLAYSSVAQFGLIVAAFGLAAYAPSIGAETAARYALLGALVHLVGHGVMKGGAFLAVGGVALSTGAQTVEDYANLARQRPFFAGSIAVLGIGLVGVPPTIGFVGKWFVAVGAVLTELWPVVVVIIFSTLLTLAYVARLLETMYFDHPGGEPHAHEGGVAADGGGDAATDGGTESVDPAADGGVVVGTRVTLAATLLVVGLALVTIALGFAGGAFDVVLEPIIDQFLAGPQEVTQ